MQTYSIGQLATHAGVPISTVRFYERRGLLKAEFRTGGNYRGYTHASLERLRFVRSAQATGLSLEDVESLLNLTHSTQPPCVPVLSLMHRRLQELRARIAELNQIEKVLDNALTACCKGQDPDLCMQVSRMTELKNAPSSTPANNVHPPGAACTSSYRTSA